MKTKTKIILGMFALLLAVPFVAAGSYELWCLKDGETVNLGQLCNPAMPVMTGPTMFCVQLLVGGKICPAALNICNGLSLSCSAAGNSTLDTEPPTLSISSPANGSVFTSKSVLISLSASESVDISYEKTSAPGKWTNLCSNCVGYDREKNFDEGTNEVTFRAVDQANNEAFYTVSFSVDSQKPKIKLFEPKEGFASGAFHVVFDEGNADKLILRYGNSNVGIRSYTFNLQTECTQSSGTTDCITNVNLADYDGQQIEAYATLSDAAGNVVESTHSQLDVDNTNPIIVSFSHSTQGKKVKFTLEINEPYFSAVTYIDNSESSPKEKSLCTKLVNNICEKEVNFNGEGNHDIVIIVKDKAGNEATQNFTFFTDSNKPKIKSILPTSGFASGLFEVSFEEENPASIILKYGNAQTGFNVQGIQLSECSHNGGNYVCSKSVDLTSYNGQEIQFAFNVTDLAGQTVEKQQKGLFVDISPPVIKSMNYTINGQDVSFSINVEEAYLKEISYIDGLDPKPREIKLCNHLTNDFCEKKVSFRNDGNHEVMIKVTDLAGHVSTQNVTFFTDSKKPKITSVAPETKFASGSFEVSFEEQNPTSLVLEYGNTGLGFRTSQLSLENDCTSVTGKYSCSKKLNISEFEGYEIDYKFTVTDRAGQTAVAGKTTLLVDTTFPKIDSLTYSLSGSKKANVIFQATEPNVGEVSYINLDDAKPMTKNFCSHLSPTGICEKKISTNPGTNRVDFTITDKAGNSAVQELVIQN